MVNTKAIKNQIKLHNTTMEAVAKDVKMHIRTFSLKVNNQLHFKVHEAIRFCELFEIPLSEIKDYFCVEEKE